MKWYNLTEREVPKSVLAKQPAAMTIQKFPEHWEDWFFKEEDSEMTLQKLVNRSMDLYLKDKKYKKLITEHEELVESGSSL